ncbi:NAD+ synthase [Helicobacter himalayensis]|uniref:NAD+ synthase n=1 Tax=Helicobacter himalayensis TaxID=1591088 RepID=UPI003D6E7E7B
MKNTISKIQTFLRDEVQKRGFQKVVLGLSGGIDSAVVAKLCVEVFKENLCALLLPASTSNEHNLKDAKLFAVANKITHHIIPITPYEREFRAFSNLRDSLNPLERLRVGNFCARMRMNLLYDYASAQNALVIGTSNKSELLLGYGTIFGDLACAINPIGNFYKTQIYTLADALNIPQKIISKPPSADLFENQSDEADLGFSYERIDTFLRAFESLLKTHNIALHTLTPQNTAALLLLSQELMVQGFEQNIVDSLLNRIARNTFKTTSPSIFKES